MRPGKATDKRLWLRGREGYLCFGCMLLLLCIAELLNGAAELIAKLLICGSSSVVPSLASSQLCLKLIV